MMFKETYCRMNQSIAPGEGLKQKVLAHAAPRRRVRWAAIPAAALLVCLLLASQVMAANGLTVYDLMYLVSPAVAQRFQPVRERCENNGIRMEVVSTAVHENIVEVYVTLQDLTGDRVDETTDLFDSYSIHRAYDCAARCERVGYDAETGTATFLITIEEWENEKILTSKLTFSVDCFLSRKAALEDVPVPLDLTEVGEGESLAAEDLGWISGRGGLEAGTADRVLVPGETLYTPAENLYITAMGYVDGRLHIQMMTDQKLTLDPHGYCYLVTREGERISAAESLSTMAEEEGRRLDYQDFIFDIAPEDLAQCTLYGSFWSSGLNTEGPWQVTFPLDQ